MVKHNNIHIALIGNPNSGKSSLFNALTGLNQKVGNFPGVTVDKKSGSTNLAPDVHATIIDLPGTYSLYPKRSDEWVTYKVLLNQDPSIHADMVILLVDASNLKRNLLFCSQIIDLKIPVVVALTMMDLAGKKGIEIDVQGLERELGIPVVIVNPRKNKGIPQLKKIVEWRARQLHHAPPRDFIANLDLASGAIQDVRRLFPEISDYTAIHYLINHEHFHLTPTLQSGVEQIEFAHNFNHTRLQAEEILATLLAHPDDHETHRLGTRPAGKDPLHRTPGQTLPRPDLGLYHPAGRTLPVVPECVLARPVPDGCHRLVLLPGGRLAGPAPARGMVEQPAGQRSPRRPERHPGLCSRRS